METNLSADTGSPLNSNLGPLSRRLGGDLQTPAFIHSKTLPFVPKISIMTSISHHIVTDFFRDLKKKKTKRKREVKAREERKEKEKKI